MVVTIDSKFYSKLQLGISKYQEKTPADPLNMINSAYKKRTNISICICNKTADLPQDNAKDPNSIF